MEVHCAHDGLVSLKELQPHPKNRNQHGADQIERLAHILKRQGWRAPIVVSKQSGYIVAGHGRLEAARLAGFTEAPVSLQDFASEELEYAHLQADNAIAAWAELDLAGINFDLAEMGPDLEVDLLGLKGFVVDPIEKLEDPADKEPKLDAVQFLVVVDCKTESVLRDVYEEMSSRGYECKIIT